ncbi:MAG: putative alpha-E superfamily protein [Algoriphagus sp.]|jgi:uncharacterized alpha-E superfamily protein
MLSRIANNLYWAGRNLERMEHIARFVPVNYFASLDGPAEMDTQYTLSNINSMAGSTATDEALSQSQVLGNVAFDKENPSSLISCALFVRENFRGTQDFISSELWESVNSLYHFVHSIDKEKYLESGMSEFMLKVQGAVALCKSKIDSTLIHNQGWSVIKIGMLLERSFQIDRIIQLKLADEQMLGISKSSLIANEYGNLLISLEAYDMNRKHYKKSVNKHRALEFLIFNEKFPRSLAFCLFELQERLEDLSLDKKGKTNSVNFIVKNLVNELFYCHMDDIKNEESEYLDKIQLKIMEINKILISNYFAYEFPAQSQTQRQS